MKKTVRTDFIINKNGMCINSDKITIWVDGPDYAEVNLYQQPSGHWIWGISMQVYNGGCGLGCPADETIRRQLTRDEAIKAAIDWMIDWAKPYSVRSSAHERLDRERHQKFILGIQAYKANLSQLSIF